MKMNKLGETKHSMKMMWGCVAFAVVAIALVAGGFGAGALFLIPCMLMMGAMMWMMMGGMGRTGGGGGHEPK
jgi:hypothetical protein